jgi:outer membrane autotransporter protein
VNEQTKSLSEGFLAGLTLLNQGADLIAGSGMSEAARATLSTRHGSGVFLTLAGGTIRHDTGSHVDMDSFSLLAGLSQGANLKAGRLTAGVFFEYGLGSYDTYNSFATAASVRGKGDAHHYGGGLLGRMDFRNDFHLEASFRAGYLTNDYRSSDLRDGRGRKAGYDASSLYYGLHVGLGYVWKITSAASLDSYAKFFWTRQEGDSVRLSTGDPVRFKSADSRRLRLGGRFSYAVSDRVSPYIGAAWEREYDGKAKATTNGYRIEAPELKGDTGIGEIGVTFSASQDAPLFIDLGAQGYVGEREGVTGSLRVRLDF